MTKVLLVLLLISATIVSAEAQWYNNSCKVNDINTSSSDEFECLWSRASKISKVGSITTLVGTSVAVSGIILTGLSSSEAADWTGIILATSGVIIDIVGIPVWITGAVRKGELKKFPQYQNLNLESMKISPSIHKNYFNNAYAFGISASLKF